MPAAAMRFVCAIISLLMLTASAHAENWPQWRGPENNGISHETGIPAKWSATENIAWKLTLPGQSGSTPVVWGDKIFLSSVAEDNEKLLLLCVSSAGKVLWQKTLGAGNRVARGDEGNSASPSPSTDGKYVWAFTGMGDLACYDFEGKEIWKYNTQDRYGRFNIQHGFSSTPVLDGDRLYLQLIHGDGNPKTREALIVAVDKNTGSEVWKQPRPSEAHTENEHSYASPIIYRDAKQAYLITHGADYVIGHDLKDGHELWRSGGLHPERGYNPTQRLVSSPAAIPGLIVVPSAKQGPVLGLRPDGKGVITDSKEFRLWTYVKTPDVSSPLIYDGLVYLTPDGFMLCLDAKTGEKVYEQRIHSAKYRGSPVFADGKVFATARDGVISVIKPGRNFELVGENDMEDDMSASPVISGGRIYLRTFKTLFAVGKK